MKPTRSLIRYATIGTIVLAMAGCATHSRKENNTLLGAGLGAAAGAVLTDGDPLYTVGGAAAGGLLGNILTDDDRRYRGSKHRGRSHAAPGHNKNKWSGKRNSRNRGHHSRRH